MDFKSAKSEYSDFGVDVDKVLSKLEKIAISVHCWQGDDVGGFERPGSVLSGGGIQTTGNYPGKARNIDELRSDFEKVLTLDGGAHRINLHASYGDFCGGFVERDKIEEKHFHSWIDWAKEKKIGIDFNGTFFSHPMAESGFTLSSKDKTVREFWIEHEKRCRRIAAYIGKNMGTPCILDTWIPDGAKNITADKIGYRAVLKDSLDKIFKEKYDKRLMRDALETKLFGIGSESFVVGSHEFYMNYAARNSLMLCIDMGHFNIGEDVSDKLSSILLFDDEVLMHISRPLHWDSDHVVLFNDAVKSVAEELVRSGKLTNVHIGLDFFDASINRIGAWAVGTRSTRKALLFAMLEPLDTLIELEQAGREFEKMALLERQATLPFGSVWKEYCRRTGAPDDDEMVKAVCDYEKKVLSGRK
ncbi:L-rhamnose isomerase [Treponema parvum]|uniref:L-rhamnose isomerase n=1 Tax=Treponema parvum TaxID=138851 RepID=A0A975EZ49_9SPIR|nr:L-rhamnose isomerase [Treponema parvum]QTQ11606.1 L-rhamnose isomerase [Treponema parvum]